MHVCVSQELDLSEKDLLHISQVNGSSPVWIRICFTRLDLSEKDLLHISHVNCWSPVWVRMCLTRSYFREKNLLQVSQVNGWSPVCKRRCATRLGFFEKHVLHISQVKGMSLLRITVVYTKILEVPKSVHCNVLYNCSHQMPFRHAMNVRKYRSILICCNVHEIPSHDTRRRSQHVNGFLSFYIVGPTI